MAALPRVGVRLGVGKRPLVGVAAPFRSLVVGVVLLLKRCRRLGDTERINPTFPIGIGFGIKTLLPWTGVPMLLGLPGGNRSWGGGSAGSAQSLEHLLLQMLSISPNTRY